MACSGRAFSSRACSLAEIRHFFNLIDAQDMQIAVLNVVDARADINIVNVSNVTNIVELSKVNVNVEAGVGAGRGAGAEPVAGTSASLVGAVAGAAAGVAGVVAGTALGVARAVAGTGAALAAASVTDTQGRGFREGWSRRGGGNGYDGDGYQDCGSNGYDESWSRERRGQGGGGGKSCRQEWVGKGGGGGGRGGAAGLVVGWSAPEQRKEKIDDAKQVGGAPGVPSPASYPEHAKARREPGDGDDMEDEMATEADRGTEEVKAHSAQTEAAVTRGSCQKIEQTGSSFEGLKIKTKSLEWDEMFIMENGQYLEVTAEPSPGYVTLAPKKGHADKFNKRTLTKEDQLCPLRFRQVFHGRAREALATMNNQLGFDNPMNLRYHEQATKLDVLGSAGKLWYQLDFVPTFQVDGKYYVTKRLPDDSADVGVTTWRQSTSIEEKYLIRDIDKHDDGCRRECTRNLKLIIAKDPSLKPITSYLVKTTMLHMNAEEGIEWGKQEHEARLCDMMQRLEGYLQSGQLPHYFIPQINLVANFTDTQRQQLVEQLRHLHENEADRKELLPKSVGDETQMIIDAATGEITWN